MQKGKESGFAGEPVHERRPSDGASTSNFSRMSVESEMPGEALFGAGDGALTTWEANRQIADAVDEVGTMSARGGPPAGDAVPGGRARTGGGAVRSRLWSPRAPGRPCACASSRRPRRPRPPARPPRPGPGATHSCSVFLDPAVDWID